MRSRRRSRPGLRTVSLRRRVALSVIAVLAAVLVLVALVVTVAFSTASKRSLSAVLVDRAQLAQQLSAQGAPPDQIQQRIDGREVRAQILLPDGTKYGDAKTKRAQADGDPVRHQELSGRGAGGAQLTLSADAPLLRNARGLLQQVLLFTALGALVVTAVAVVVIVRVALSPLDAMTELARGIVGGGRGQRLNPERTDTELGRTASAFDDMLDALEGAESQAREAEQTARSSEERTRRFVADAAHELRTPLTGVRAAAEAVLQQAPDADPSEREQLHLLLVREAARAGTLVDDLLDLARLDAGVHELRRAEVDLRDVVTAQAERVRLQYPDIEVRVEGEPLPVIADGDRLSQVVANVLNNACQASAPDGTVTAELIGNEERAELAVADTGPGVPVEERERIFDRLVRLDEARDRRAGGSGLGLATARGFARAHGGELTCEDPGPAGGALFRLVLPLDASGTPEATST
jgi:signal transduction histidine kinase